MLLQTTSIWQHDSQPKASGRPGAVQSHVLVIEDEFLIAKYIGCLAEDAGATSQVEDGARGQFIGEAAVEVVIGAVWVVFVVELNEPLVVIVHVARLPAVPGCPAEPKWRPH